MKGKISLSKFIESVKSELIEASQCGANNPQFSIEEIALETEFSIEAEGTAGFRFVVDLEGKAKGMQAHRVKLLLKPIRIAENDQSVGGLTWRIGEDGKASAVAYVPVKEDPSKPTQA